MRKIKTFFVVIILLLSSLSPNPGIKNNVETNCFKFIESPVYMVNNSLFAVEDNQKETLFKTFESASTIGTIFFKVWAPKTGGFANGGGPPAASIALPPMAIFSMKRDAQNIMKASMGSAKSNLFGKEEYPVGNHKYRWSVPAEGALSLIFADGKDQYKDNSGEFSVEVYREADITAAPSEPYEDFTNFERDNWNNWQAGPAGHDRIAAPSPTRPTPSRRGGSPAHRR